MWVHIQGEETLRGEAAIWGCLPLSHLLILEEDDKAAGKQLSPTGQNWSSVLTKEEDVTPRF